MANRIVTATVTGETIKLSSKNAGTAGSDRAVSLAITFDSTWDSTPSKIVQFLDAYGANPVNITLTSGMIVGGAYIVPIRSEPLKYAGEMTVTIRGVEFEVDGTTVKRVIMSASTTMNVQNSLYNPNGVAPVQPTPTQAEQLLASVNSVTGMTVTSETLASGSPATIEKTTNVDGTINIDFGLPTGPQGAAGRSIVSVIKTGTVGLVDTYTITFSDATTQTFSISNGVDGVDGATGNGIASVALISGTHAAGTTDTYRITFTDTTTFDFTVYNGADGLGAGDMVKAVYDPQNKNADAFNRENHTGTQLSSTISNFVSTVLATVLTGFSTASSAVISATDTVISALGKLQAQITSHTSDIALNQSNYHNINIRTFGAIGDGATHPLSSKYATLAAAQAVYPFATALTQEMDWAALQLAVNTVDNVKIPKGTYLISSTVAIPQARNIVISGEGSRTSVLKIGSSMVGLSYLRNNSYTGTTLEINNIQLIETNLGKTSYGISFKGSDVSHHDNQIRIEKCSIYGFSRGVDLGYCGSVYAIDIFSQVNNVVYFLNRDSSFVHFERCMNLDNGGFIYADDSLADGVSNGITIIDCASVLSTGIDIRILGWQAVTIIGGGYDLGYGGTHAIAFSACQDIFINCVWVASNIVTAPSRIGIGLQGCHSWNINSCSVVNNYIGIRVDASATIGSKATIHGNKFSNSTTNDIVMFDTCGLSITDNHFVSTPDRTGTNYEIYAVTSNYNIAKNNFFRLATYPISLGANSIVGDNVFGVTPV